MSTQPFTMPVRSEVMVPRGLEDFRPLYVLHDGDVYGVGAALKNTSPQELNDIIDKTYIARLHWPDSYVPEGEQPRREIRPVMVDRREALQAARDPDSKTDYMYAWSESDGWAFLPMEAAVGGHGGMGWRVLGDADREVESPMDRARRLRDYRMRTAIDDYKRAQTRQKDEARAEREREREADGRMRAQRRAAGMEAGPWSRFVNRVRRGRGGRDMR